MDDINDAIWYGELWADSDVDQTTLSESFNNVTMSFDLIEGSVTVVSELRNTKDEPMFEFKMTPATGEIVQVSRTKDGLSEKTINKDVDPSELTSNNAESPVGSLE